METVRDYDDIICGHMNNGLIIKATPSLSSQVSLKRCCCAVVVYKYNLLRHFVINLVAPKFLFMTQVKKNLGVDIHKTLYHFYKGENVCSRQHVGYFGRALGGRRSSLSTFAHRRPSLRGARLLSCLSGC